MDSKFSGMLKPKPAKVKPEAPIAINDESPTPAPRKRGRPVTKATLSTNPDYRPSTVWLNINNYADAQARLRKGRASRSMSDLLNELLADWLKTSAE